TIAGLSTGVMLVVIRRIIHWLSPDSINPFDSLRPSLKGELSGVGIMIGALVGGVSHPFLDGIMHQDVRPFAPWGDANPFLGVIGLEALHLGCLFLGLVGLV